jgi:hypothetical protein
MNARVRTNSFRSKEGFDQRAHLITPQFRASFCVAMRRQRRRNRSCVHVKHRRSRTRNLLPVASPLTSRTTVQECLSVIYALERLRCYLEATRFTVVTDHYSLLWLNNVKDPLGRIGRLRF